MRKIKLKFLNIAKDKKERFWFFDNNTQFLGYMLSDFSRVNPVRKLSQDVKINSFVARHVYINDDNSKIYVTSINAVRVVVYDMEKEIFHYYEGKPFCKGDSYNVVRNGIFLIFIPYDIRKKAYCFDIMTDTFIEIEWYKTTSAVFGEVEYLFQKDTLVYLPLIGTNCMVKCNLIDFTYEEVFFEQGVQLNSIFVEDDGIWITQRNTEEVIYYDNKEKQYFKYQNGYGTVNCAFGAITSVGDKLIVLPRLCNYIALIDKVKKDINKIRVKDFENGVIGQAALFGGCYTLDNQIILLPWRNENIYLLNCDVHQIIKKETIITEMDYWTSFLGGTLQEKEDWCLDDFMNLVKCL